MVVINDKDNVTVEDGKHINYIKQNTAIFDTKIQQFWMAKHDSMIV